MRRSGRNRVSAIAIAGSCVLGCAAGEGPCTPSSAWVGEASSGSGGETVDPREDTSGVGDASFTGADETPSGSDSNASEGTTGPCDAPQELFRDGDGDGWGIDDETTSGCDGLPGWAPQAGDCDDGDAEVHPTANEPCGAADRDCDFTAAPLCGSCLQVLVEGEPDGDGLYSIDSDDDGPLAPAQVWCDMTTDGGGWTLVQRTVWDPGQTAALRTGFASWRDVTVGNASPELGYRLQGAAWPSLSVQLEHMLRHVPRLADGSSCDPLDYVGIDGNVSVTQSDAFITGLVAPVTMINADQLSTLDAGPGMSCVVDATATPWFYGSCCATCPTYQGGYWPEPHPMFSYAETADFHGNTVAEVCASEPMTSMGYWGLNAMEYYLR